MTTPGTIKATSQDVTREGGVVRILLVIDADPALSMMVTQFEFAEPVEIAAGDRPAISLMWPRLRLGVMDYQPFPLPVTEPFTATSADQPLGMVGMFAIGETAPAPAPPPALDPVGLAAAFATWAEAEGLLPLIDKAECARLAKAFGAGYVRGRQDLP